MMLTWFKAPPSLAQRRAVKPARALRASLALVAATLLLISTAQAETRVVDRARLTLGQLLPNAPESLADKDLGAAPAPGAVLALTRRELRARLDEAGIDSSRLQLPSVLRIQSAVRNYSSRELERLISPALKSALQPGVTLLGTKLSTRLRLPPRVSVGHVRMPKLQKRVGTQRLTATVELLHGDTVLQRLPVGLSLRVSAAALVNLVEKGSPIDVVVEQGNVSISAAAVALGAGNLGEVIFVRVQRTRKTLRARILSRHRAKLEES